MEPIKSIPPFAIVLVTYNRKDKLSMVLQRITLQTLMPRVVVIVDNNSTDGTEKLLYSLDSTLPKFHVIRNPENVGHGAALAIGLQWAIENTDVPYLMLLEDDSFPSPELCSEMISRVEASGFDLVGVDGLMFRIGKRFRPPLFREVITEVDFALLDGAAITRKLILSVGYPKSDFFMMCDDLEYAKRIKKYGFKIGCIKNSAHEILHEGGGERFSKNNLWRGYYQARNSVHVLREHFSIAALLDTVIIEIKRSAGASLAHDRFVRVGLRLLGVWHGITGVRGKTVDPARFRA